MSNEPMPNQNLIMSPPSGPPPGAGTSTIPPNFNVVMNPSVSNQGTTNYPGPSFQDHLFGLVNEAGTNLSHVPTDFANTNHNFTFQRARFALSGPQLQQLLLAQQD